ncbi:unnamed protein product [Amoebophrya sp. A120]|nr:unnamed protein product [Amoebophrya sp. A120]|eukprot:GSA120T00007587001.1
MAGSTFSEQVRTVCEILSVDEALAKALIKKFRSVDVACDKYLSNPERFANLVATMNVNANNTPGGGAGTRNGAQQGGSASSSSAAMHQANAFANYHNAVLPNSKTTQEMKLAEEAAAKVAAQLLDVVAGGGDRSLATNIKIGAPPTGASASSSSSSALQTTAEPNSIMDAAKREELRKTIEALVLKESKDLLATTKSTEPKTVDELFAQYSRTHGGSAGGSSSSSSLPFCIPSNKFLGAKPGYYFGTKNYEVMGSRQDFTAMTNTTSPHDYHNMKERDKEADARNRSLVSIRTLVGYHRDFTGERLEDRYGKVVRDLLVERLPPASFSSGIIQQHQEVGLGGDQNNGLNITGRRERDEENNSTNNLNFPGQTVGDNQVLDDVEAILQGVVDENEDNSDVVGTINESILRPPTSHAELAMRFAAMGEQVGPAGNRNYAQHHRRGNNRDRHYDDDSFISDEDDFYSDEDSEATREEELPPEYGEQLVYEDMRFEKLSGLTRSRFTEQPDTQDERRTHKHNTNYRLDYEYKSGPLSYRDTLKVFDFDKVDGDNKNFLSGSSSSSSSEQRRGLVSCSTTTGGHKNALSSSTQQHLDAASRTRTFFRFPELLLEEVNAFLKCVTRVVTLGTKFSTTKYNQDSSFYKSRQSFDRRNQQFLRESIENALKNWMLLGKWKNPLRTFLQLDNQKNVNLRADAAMKSYDSRKEEEEVGNSPDSIISDIMWRFALSVHRVPICERRDDCAEEEVAGGAGSYLDGEIPLEQCGPNKRLLDLLEDLEKREKELAAQNEAEQGDKSKKEMKSKAENKSGNKFADILSKDQVDPHMGWIKLNRMLFRGTTTDGGAGDVKGKLREALSEMEQKLEKFGFADEQCGTINTSTNQAVGSSLSSSSKAPAKLNNMLQENKGITPARYESVRDLSPSTRQYIEQLRFVYECSLKNEKNRASERRPPSTAASDIYTAPMLNVLERMLQEREQNSCQSDGGQEPTTGASRSSRKMHLQKNKSLLKQAVMQIQQCEPTNDVDCNQTGVDPFLFRTHCPHADLREFDLVNNLHRREREAEEKKRRQRDREMEVEYEKRQNIKSSDHPFQTGKLLHRGAGKDKEHNAVGEKRSENSDIEDEDAEDRDTDNEEEESSKPRPLSFLAGVRAGQKHVYKRVANWQSVVAMKRVPNNMQGKNINKKQNSPAKKHKRAESEKKDKSRNGSKNGKSSKLFKQQITPSGHNNKTTCLISDIEQVVVRDEDEENRATFGDNILTSSATAPAGSTTATTREVAIHAYPHESSYFASSEVVYYEAVSSWLAQPDDIVKFPALTRRDMASMLKTTEKSILTTSSHILNKPNFAADGKKDGAEQKSSSKNTSGASSKAAPSKHHNHHTPFNAPKMSKAVKLDNCYINENFLGTGDFVRLHHTMPSPRWQHSLQYSNKDREFKMEDLMKDTAATILEGDSNPANFGVADKPLSSKMVFCKVWFALDHCIARLVEHGIVEEVVENYEQILASWRASEQNDVTNGSDVDHAEVEDLDVYGTTFRSSATAAAAASLPPPLPLHDYNLLRDKIFSLPQNREVFEVRQKVLRAMVGMLIMLMTDDFGTKDNVDLLKFCELLEPILLASQTKNLPASGHLAPQIPGFDAHPRGQEPMATTGEQATGPAGESNDMDVDFEEINSNAMNHARTTDQKFQMLKSLDSTIVAPRQHPTSHFHKELSFLTDVENLYKSLNYGNVSGSDWDQGSPLNVEMTNDMLQNLANFVIDLPSFFKFPGATNDCCKAVKDLFAATYNQVHKTLPIRGSAVGKKAGAGQGVSQLTITDGKEDKEKEDGGVEDATSTSSKMELYVKETPATGSDFVVVDLMASGTPQPSNTKHKTDMNKTHARVIRPDSVANCTPSLMPLQELCSGATKRAATDSLAGGEAAGDAASQVVGKANNCSSAFDDTVVSKNPFFANAFKNVMGETMKKHKATSSLDNIRPSFLQETSSTSQSSATFQQRFPVDITELLLKNAPSIGTSTAAGGRAKSMKSTKEMEKDHEKDVGGNNKTAEKNGRKSKRDLGDNENQKSEHQPDHQQDFSIPTNLTALALEQNPCFLVGQDKTDLTDVFATQGQKLLIGPSRLEQENAPLPPSIFSMDKRKIGLMNFHHRQRAEAQRKAQWEQAHCAHLSTGWKSQNEDRPVTRFQWLHLRFYSDIHCMHLNEGINDEVNFLRDDFLQKMAVAVENPDATLSLDKTKFNPVFGLGKDGLGAHEGANPAMNRLELMDRLLIRDNRLDDCVPRFVKSDHSASNFSFLSSYQPHGKGSIENNTEQAHNSLLGVVPIDIKVINTERHLLVPTLTTLQKQKDNPAGLGGGAVDVTNTQEAASAIDRVYKRMLAGCNGLAKEKEKAALEDDVLRFVKTQTASKPENGKPSGAAAKAKTGPAAKSKAKAKAAPKAKAAMKKVATTGGKAGTAGASANKEKADTGDQDLTGTSLKLVLDVVNAQKVNFLKECNFLREQHVQWQIRVEFGRIFQRFFLERIRFAPAKLEAGVAIWNSCRPPSRDYVIDRKTILEMKKKQDQLLAGTTGAGGASASSKAMKSSSKDNKGLLGLTGGPLNTRTNAMKKKNKKNNSEKDLHSQSQTKDFQRFEIMNNDNDPTGEMPPGWSRHHPLRPEQLRSLYWMQKREHDSDYLQVEYKRYLPAKRGFQGHQPYSGRLEGSHRHDPSDSFHRRVAEYKAIKNCPLSQATWSLEFNMTANYNNRGGILADKIGFGKTATCIGLLASSKAMDLGLIKNWLRLANRDTEDNYAGGASSTTVMERKLSKEDRFQLESERDLKLNQQQFSNSSAENSEAEDQDEIEDEEDDLLADDNVKTKNASRPPLKKRKVDEDEKQDTSKKGKKAAAKAVAAEAAGSSSTNVMKKDNKGGTKQQAMKKEKQGMKTAAPEQDELPTQERSSSASASSAAGDKSTVEQQDANETKRGGKEEKKQLTFAKMCKILLREDGAAAGTSNASEQNLASGRGFVSSSSSSSAHGGPFSSASEEEMLWTNSSSSTNRSSPSTSTHESAGLFPAPKTTLILVPSHLIDQWSTEIEKFLPNNKLKILVCKNISPLKIRTVYDLQQYDVILVTYRVLYSSVHQSRFEELSGLGDDKLKEEKLEEKKKKEKEKEQKKLEKEQQARRKKADQRLGRFHNSLGYRPYYNDDFEDDDLTGSPSDDDMDYEVDVFGIRRPKPKKKKKEEKKDDTDFQLHQHEYITKLRENTRVFMSSTHSKLPVRFKPWALKEKVKEDVLVDLDEVAEEDKEQNDQKTNAKTSSVPGRGSGTTGSDMMDVDSTNILVDADASKSKPGVMKRGRSKPSAAASQASQLFGNSVVPPASKSRTIMDSVYPKKSSSAGGSSSSSSSSSIKNDKYRLLLFPLLEQFYFRRIVFDEFHELEAFEDKQVSSLLNLKAFSKFGLTGTPQVDSVRNVAATASLFGVDLCGVSQVEAEYADRLHRLAMRADLKDPRSGLSAVMDPLGVSCPNFNFKRGQKSAKPDGGRRGSNDHRQYEYDLLPMTEWKCNCCLEPYVSGNVPDGRSLTVKSVKFAENNSLVLPQSHEPSTKLAFICQHCGTHNHTADLFIAGGNGKLLNQLNHGRANGDHSGINRARAGSAAPIRGATSNAVLRQAGLIANNANNAARSGGTANNQQAQAGGSSASTARALHTTTANAGAVETLLPPEEDDDDYIHQPELPGDLLLGEEVQEDVLMQSSPDSSFQSEHTTSNVNHNDMRSELDTDFDRDGDEDDEGFSDDLTMSDYTPSEDSFLYGEARRRNNRHGGGRGGNNGSEPATFQIEPFGVYGARLQEGFTENQNTVGAYSHHVQNVSKGFCANVRDCYFTASRNAFAKQRLKYLQECHPWDRSKVFRENCEKFLQRFVRQNSAVTDADKIVTKEHWIAVSHTAEERAIYLAQANAMNYQSASTSSTEEPGGAAGSSTFTGTARGPPADPFGAPLSGSSRNNALSSASDTALEKRAKLLQLCSHHTLGGEGSSTGAECSRIFERKLSAVKQAVTQIKGVCRRLAVLKAISNSDPEERRKGFSKVLDPVSQTAASYVRQQQAKMKNLSDKKGGSATFVAAMKKISNAGGAQGAVASSSSANARNNQTKSSVSHKEGAGAASSPEGKTSNAEQQELGLDLVCPPIVDELAINELDAVLNDAGDLDVDFDDLDGIKNPRLRKKDKSYVASANSTRAAPLTASQKFPKRVNSKDVDLEEMKRKKQQDAEKKRRLAKTFADFPFQAYSFLAMINNEEKSGLTREAVQKLFNMESSSSMNIKWADGNKNNSYDWQNVLSSFFPTADNLKKIQKIQQKWDHEREQHEKVSRAKFHPKFFESLPEKEKKKVLKEFDLKENKQYEELQQLTMNKIPLSTNNSSSSSSSKAVSSAKAENNKAENAVSFLRYQPPAPLKQGEVDANAKGRKKQQELGVQLERLKEKTISEFLSQFSALREVVNVFAFFRKTLQIYGNKDGGEQQEKPEDDDDDGRKCVLCLEDQLPVSSLSITSCGHVFCVECVHRQMRAEHNQCALCRKPLRGSKDIYSLALEMKSAGVKIEAKNEQQKIDQLRDENLQLEQMKAKMKSKPGKPTSEHQNGGAFAAANSSSASGAAVAGATSADLQQPTTSSYQVQKYDNDLISEKIRDPEKHAEFGSKIQAICQVLLHIEETEPGAKVILFCQWKNLMTKIGSCLEKYGFNYGTLTGDAIAQNKKLSEFKNMSTATARPPDSKDTTSKSAAGLAKSSTTGNIKGPKSTNILLLSLETSAAGTNLAEVCHHCLLVHPMNATTVDKAISFELQAIGRIRRYGQKAKEIHVWRFLTLNSVEEEIVREHAEAIKLRQETKKQLLR